MKLFLSKLSESVLLTLVATFILYWILAGIIDYPDYSNNLSGFYYWLNDLFQGRLLMYMPPVDSFGMDADGISTPAIPIEVFSSSMDSIGNNFLHTIGLSIACLTIGIFLSLIVNVFIIFSTGPISRLAKGLEIVISFVSGVHVIVLAIFLYKIIEPGNSSFTSVLIVFLIICGSNVFYNISSQQHITLMSLKGADYILASKAWGDSSLRQMSRTKLLMIINQFTTMLAPILTNTIIVEIIFQRVGLGSALYREVFSETKYPDIGIIIAITLLVILLIQFFNVARQSIEKFLLGYR